LVLDKRLNSEIYNMQRVKFAKCLPEEVHFHFSITSFLGEEGDVA